MPKSKKQTELEQQVGELTQDLQRVRADFENYRKRVEIEKESAKQSGKTAAIYQLLPVIDDIERAITYMPTELAENKWAQSIVGLTKKLDKSLDALNLKRIDTSKGVAFNPELHEAVQFDEEAEGEHEVVAEGLQAGYTLNGTPIRHAMVKVTKQ